METTLNSAPSPPAGSRALVVEDERALGGPGGELSERDGFEATKKYDGLPAVMMARDVDPDLSRGFAADPDVLRCPHRRAIPVAEWK